MLYRISCTYRPTHVESRKEKEEEEVFAVYNLFGLKYRKKKISDHTRKLFIRIYCLIGVRCFYY